MDGVASQLTIAMICRDREAVQLQLESPFEVLDNAESSILDKCDSKIGSNTSAGRSPSPMSL